MATNKHAYIRYQALDKCFGNKRRKFFIDDLIAACEKSLYEYTGNTISVSKRQIYDDINFMESTEGFSIDLEKMKDGKRVHYRYQDVTFSINKHLLTSEESSQLKETLLTLSRFKGLPQFDWIDEMLARLSLEFGISRGNGKLIDFEQNPYLKGLDHFAEVYEALTNHRTIEIEYQGFKQSAPEKLIFHPYYLKQFNSRWFLFGLINERKSVTNLSLDRILNISSSNLEFIPNTEIEFASYFDDIIGVTIPGNKQVENIELQVDKDIWPYIETKPIHGSQRVLRRTQYHIVIELKVVPNYEFERLLMSYGEAITVVQPLHLRHRIIELTENILKNYF